MNFNKIAAAFTLLLALAGCGSSDDKGGSENTTDPNQAIINKLSGGTTRTWYWAAGETGHLGFGDNTTDNSSNFYGNRFQAAAFQYANNPVSDCLYDNKLIFTLQGGVLRFTLDNGGSTFFNSSFLSIGGGTGPDDACLTYAAGDAKTVTFADSGSYVAQSGVANRTTGKAMTFSDGGFMGYYIGQSTYEIMAVSDTRLVVRAIMGNDTGTAVYHTFTTTQPNLPANENFTNLVWSEEFSTPGAPDATKWSYNTGAGGWGNNESQYYTTSLDNAVIEDGKLKITAKKEIFMGSDYTSARLVTDGKFDFTYGRAVIRAKLPSGAGTWPAIWMLGSNYTTAAWPACGEIDIMEHVGNQQNTIHGTLHYPGHFGGNGNSGTTNNPTASTEFHEYSVVWNEDVIKFYVDDTMYHSFVNDASTPFNHDFFFILNVAMGGNFGGNIDPDFTQASMEVDYVRVYQ
jgi:beta-glucanase (GH16 family)